MGCSSLADDGERRGLISGLAAACSARWRSLRSFRHLLIERPRLADAGVQVSQEALDPSSLGLDGRTQILLQFQALTDELAPVRKARSLVVIGEPDLRHAVFPAKHQGNLVEIEPEQLLELPDAGDTREVGLG